MERGTRAERIVGDIIRLCHAGLEAATLRAEALKRLRQVIPLDAAFFGMIDPATLLFTGGLSEDPLDRLGPHFLANEHLQNDVNKFAHLATGPGRIAGLYEATRGEPQRSPRYRDLLVPLSLGDELRAALVADGACWGALCLHRERGAAAFTPAEAAVLGRLAPHLAHGLRGALLLPAAAASAAPTGPGLLVLDDDFAVAASTPAAQRWLDEVAAGDWPAGWALPPVVYAVAARLRALERGEPPAAGDQLPRARLRTAAGRWLVVHASRLAGPATPGQTAIILEEARPAEIAPLILAAYDLTEAEGRVTRLVLHGRSTAQIAEQLFLSPNTVQDHLKAIFAKVDVRSRRELVARVFAQQYQPRLATGAAIGPDGWFADARAERPGR
jgi:DNA-binding CsgD family transcriptional regulator